MGHDLRCAQLAHARRAADWRALCLCFGDWRLESHRLCIDWRLEFRWPIWCASGQGLWRAIGAKMAGGRRRLAWLVGVAENARCVWPGMSTSELRDGVIKDLRRECRRPSSVAPFFAPPFAMMSAPQAPHSRMQARIRPLFMSPCCDQLGHGGVQLHTPLLSPLASGGQLGARSAP